MERLNLDDLTACVAARLRVARGVTVFALWRDGSVTEEGLGFRKRGQADGRMDEPLATFVSGRALTSETIRERIAEAMRRRGLRV